MDLGLKGKRALVSGASQGIGKAIALEFAKEGADVTLFARNADSLAKVLEEIKEVSNGNHNYLVADFQNPEDVASVLSKSIEDGMNYDVVINNTGGPSPGPANAADVSAFENAFKLHLSTNQTILQLVLPSMKEKGFGRIINIISTSVKQPLDNLGVSNTIRGAVASWAKTIANELGQFGITVNNVLPGATETARLDAIINRKSEVQGKPKEEVIAADHKTIPVRRFGKAEEIAAAAVFLSSDRAGYITGTNLPVDGGRTKSL